MLIVFGTRLAGGIEYVGRAHVATRFFHVMLFPLLPLGGVAVAADGTRVPAQLVKRSMLVAYLQWYGGFVTAATGGVSLLGACGVVYDRRVELASVLAAGIGGILALGSLALTVAAWTTMGSLAPTEIGKRLAFARCSGLAVHPRHLGMRAVDLLDELRTQVSPDEDTPNVASWAVAWIERTFAVLEEDVQLWTAREELRWSLLTGQPRA